MASPPLPVTAKHLEYMEVFAGLSPEALTDVAARGQVRTLVKGTIIFAQGAPAEHCHALLTGRVRIAQSGEAGGQLIIRFIGPGEMFGTMALFTDRRYPAEATTMSDSVEIGWAETALLELIHRYPQIALNLVRIVGARLREVQERLRELATQRVDQRMAHVLLRLVNQHGRVDRAETTIDFPITRQDLAALCGTTLYSASRVLSAWGKAGLLTTQRKRLTLCNLGELRRLAGDSQSHGHAGARGKMKGDL